MHLNRNGSDAHRRDAPTAADRQAPMFCREFRPLLEAAVLLLQWFVTRITGGYALDPLFVDRARGLVGAFGIPSDPYCRRVKDLGVMSACIWHLAKLRHGRAGNQGRGADAAVHHHLGGGDRLLPTDDRACRLFERAA